ncbi:outer membrane protein ompA [Beggiatoa sp. PS]|nr:outer membrane protein ompA [Beggiatoa sp. PS]
MSNLKMLTVGLIFSLSSPIMASPCDEATELNYQAYESTRQGFPTSRAKHLLERALALCPNHAESYNNLAELFSTESDYAQAITHYRRALQINSNLSTAWYGLGETYYKQDQFPQSLEAHLHACQTDKDSRQRVVELLKDNRYAVTEEGKILEKDSLLLLYDPSRRHAMEQLITACGLKAKIRHVIVFRNLVFNTSTTTLKQASTRQLQKIASVLKMVDPTMVKVKGHSDAQPWRGRSQSESKRLNLKLSQQRAESVKNVLVNEGFPKNLTQAKGYGSNDPLVLGNSPAIWAKNRRVEIEVK